MIGAEARAPGRAIALITTHVACYPQEIKFLTRKFSGNVRMKTMIAHKKYGMEEQNRCLLIR